MKDIFVFSISSFDNFQVPGARKVNINDTSEFQYTFWAPREGGRKLLYATPRRFSDVALDLLYISLMVYYVDKKVCRSEQADAWTRDFELYIPVKNIEKWESCNQLLAAALNFLTGDHWVLHFRSWLPLTSDESKYSKGRYWFRRSVRKIDTDTFCMLSGGLDSFIGAINLLKNGRKPIFVSHYGGGKGVKGFQDSVVNLLSSQYKLDSKRFYRFYAAAQDGKEESTRSRSLMFFAHAIVIASGMNHHVDLYIPENGVISLNIPLTVMRLGSLSTRTTHPYFMGLLQNLVHGIGLDITLINPFQFLTKGEMIKKCLDVEFLNKHYHHTMSCSHPDQGRWSGQQVGHCGECLPCTIRRASIKAAGLEDASFYRHNYDTLEGKKLLKSYRLGIMTPKDSYAAIQMSGPLNDHYDEYADLYDRGLNELKNFIDSL